MRTIETKAHYLNELSEAAQQNAIEHLSDINVDCDWWDCTYDDAEQIGLKITSFDLGRGAYVEGNFIGSAHETAELIIKNHGEHCETYQTAKNFLAELEVLTGKYDNIEDCPEDEIEALEADFLKSLLEDYSIMLQHEYEYLTSDEAIIETILVNEYEFTENGKLI